MKLRIVSLLMVVIPFTLFATYKKSEWQVFTSKYLYFNGQTHGKKNLETGRVNLHPTSLITDVASAANGDIYIATPRGLFVFNGDDLKRLKISGPGFGSNVRALALDKSGNLWIGSNFGLVKYKNGAIIESFTKDDQGFEARIVREILIDKQGNVWIAGWVNGFGLKPSGLSKYDGTSWTNYNSENSPLVKDFVEDLALDAKGNIWMSVGFQDQGVARFDGTNWSVYNKDNSGLTTNIIRSIASDAAGNMFFGTPKGLLKFDGTNWSSISLNDVFANKFMNFMSQMQAPPDISALAFDANEVLWIGTKNNGVFRYTPQSKAEFTVVNSPLTNNAIRKIFVDGTNRKWFLTGSWYENWSDRFLEEKSSLALQLSFQGVISFREPDYYSFPKWKTFNTWTAEIPTDVFYNVVAIDNTIWITSPDKGLLRMQGVEVEQYAANSNITGDRFKDFAFGTDGTIWIASNMNGLFRFKDGVFDNWGKGSDLGNIASGVSVGPKGHVWVGSKTGISEFDGSNFTTYDSKSTEVNLKTIQTTTWDSKGQLWAGTYKGVAVYDGASWKEFNKKSGGLEGTYAKSIVHCSNGETWVGTMKGVAVSKDGSTWEMIKKLEEIPFFSVNTIAETTDGTIWVGTTSKGLLRYSGGSWTVYNSENSGLSYDQVLDLSVDANGALWMTANKAKVATVGSFPSSLNSNEPPDPAIEIKKKIQALDPAGAVIKFTP